VRGSRDWELRSKNKFKNKTERQRQEPDLCFAKMGHPQKIRSFNAEVAERAENAEKDEEEQVQEPHVRPLRGSNMGHPRHRRRIGNGI